MRVDLGPAGRWRHDLSHCLHTTAGVLLTFHGLDPVRVLGAGWGFSHRPGDVRREEYFFPGEGPLFADLAPHHAVSSVWHEPADADSGWREVRAKLAAGTPVAVAADNFHLPFRPAYRDVHTNHLLTVFGFDDEAGEVLVADPVPPAFQGAISLETFTAARDSGNPIRHDRDMFFTANPIGNRWLELVVGPEQPAFDLGFVRHVLAANAAALGEGRVTPGLVTGLAGLRHTLTGLLERYEGDEVAVDDLFILGGAVLAVTGLHAEFLALAGRRFGMSGLGELARSVDRIAHHWAAFRIAVATGRADRAAAVPGLLARAERLLAAYEVVAGEMACLGTVAARVRVPA
ncbi:BtrH N-terminal domain-containing protein [Amycolatopsis sp. NPDC049253]|uniref:BtrH N-terminal domain-containing protein n=1 Tax=Amycolatopsis sp. NPDC049253 TaxID=3155274 RepID=UPI003446EA33